jgi:glycosyltransferase involved in cell wall biosynthesis
MKRPAVSILMPLRNAEPWVTACIESIRAQTFQDWELIVVDDLSQDASTQLVSAQRDQDERIMLVENTGTGIIPALQTAFALASGSFITRMDADDLMPKDKLAVFYATVIQQSDHIITGKVKYFGDTGIVVSDGYRSYEQWLNERISKKDHWDWIYRECVIASANWMAHRSLVNFNDLIYPEDYDLVFHWYQQRIQITGINEVTHLWREHPHRTSRTSANYQQERFFALKLDRFLSLDHDTDKELRILGKNVKTKLVMKRMDQARVPYQIAEKEDLKKFRWDDSIQVLIAVYPSLDQRMAIMEFFQSKGLFHGKNYWWI